MGLTGNLRSIVAMLVAVGFFSLMDAVLKTLVAHYPSMQVAALRGWTSLPLVLLYVAWRGALGRIWHTHWGAQGVRGVLGISMLFLFAYGVRDLPLASAYTIFFIAPILITVLSIPVLGERVPRAHWWAIAAGMVGVLVALRPGAQGLLSWASLAMLGAAACYAVSAIMSRVLSRTESSENLVLWMMVMMSVGAGLLAWPQWVPLRGEDTALLLALAVTGFGGQLAITEAFRHGQASAVAPFEYTALAWGLGLDWLVWQALPDGWTLVGAAIIVASGVYLVRREKVHATAEHP